jgi:hypothetical protein
MTRLEEIIREIEEKQEEISDLVKELKEKPEEEEEIPEEFYDKPAGRVYPAAVYLNEEELRTITEGYMRHMKKNKSAYSRSGFMRKILLDYCEER